MTNPFIEYYQKEYEARRISRREFAGRLGAAGVAATAATLPAHRIGLGAGRHAGQGRSDAGRLVHPQRERHAEPEPADHLARLHAGVSDLQPDRALLDEAHRGAGPRHRVECIGRPEDLAIQDPQRRRVPQRQVPDRSGLHLHPEPPPGREVRLHHQGVAGRHRGHEGGWRLARDRSEGPERRLPDVPGRHARGRGAGRLRGLRQPRRHRPLRPRQLPARSRHAGEEEPELPPRGISARRRGGELRQSAIPRRASTRCSPATSTSRCASTRSRSRSSRVHRTPRWRTRRRAGT